MDGNSRVKLIIGDRIRLIRKQKRLTQKGLAELAELNEKYISRLEHGEENTTLDTLLKITSAMGITLEELFKGVQHAKDESGLLINQIISILQTKTEEDQKFFFDMISLIQTWRR